MIILYCEWLIDVKIFGWITWLFTYHFRIYLYIYFTSILCLCDAWDKINGWGKMKAFLSVVITEINFMKLIYYKNQCFLFKYGKMINECKLEEYQVITFLIK